jgi:uncharacterized protein
MKSKLISGSSEGNIGANERTFAVIFDAGDEVIASLEAFAAEERLSASQFSAIGAFKDAVLGYFDWGKKAYEKIPIEDQVEILSLIGDITLKDGKPNIHAHVVVGKRDATAHGGHLLEARVRPTLEVILTEVPKHLTRHLDTKSGLALIGLEENK